MSHTERTLEFRRQLAERPREELLELIELQDVDLRMQVQRIEWVFENKLKHLTWDDGSPIEGRPVTNEELVLLIDEPFTPDPDLTKMGLSITEQRDLHIARDPVTWARKFLGITLRAYQIMILRWPNNRKVLRAGRRLGKTTTMSVFLLHYAYTHKNGRSVVVAPMKTQVELIYNEMLRWARQNDVVAGSITRNITSPQFLIEFSNGSTIRFFTSGMRSGGRSDVVRGQEAHLIVLDELDYMHADDLNALYAMLQKTAENQIDKILLGASTPTGRREHFWQWCRSPRFKEFWYPSYVNPYFEKEVEDEFREVMTEMVYRHEVEADFGEDAEGVYPRKYIDLAFSSGRYIAEASDSPDDIIGKSDWKYRPEPISARSNYIIGVDWDKYGAGTNIVVLEICNDDYEDLRSVGRVRMAYREEIPRDEYTLTNAVERIIELNRRFDPKHIYVDRGFGEVQVELLHKYGVEHPTTNLKTRVRGVSFAETFEMRDPFTRELVKKEIKPFMVDNLRQMLEKEQIVFPSSDEELYQQLTSYVVVRKTGAGRPVFEASGIAEDHIHDALILACFAIVENYGELMKTRYATQSISFNQSALSSLLELSTDAEEREIEEEALGRVYQNGSAPVVRRRSMTASLRNSRAGGSIRRSSF